MQWGSPNPVPASDASRVAFVDTAKGICIILVVMMHTTLGIEKAAGAESWLHPAILFAQPFRMPDFFLIAGLFLARVINRDWRTYLDRKVVHFLYFYLAWAVIQWAMKSAAPALASGDAATALADLAAILWDPAGALWFIYLLPVFFVVARLVWRLPHIAVLAVAAAVQIAPIESPWFILDEFQGRFVYFLAGAFAAPHVFAFARLVERHRGPTLVGLAAWALGNGVLVFAGLAAAPGIGLALGLAGALAVVAIATLLAGLPAAAWLTALGRRSIVVFLAFFVPMVVLRAVALRLGLDLGLAALLVTAASVIAPIIARRIVAGTPLIALFERPAWARLHAVTKARRKSVTAPAFTATGGHHPHPH